MMQVLEASPADARVKVLVEVVIIVLVLVVECVLSVCSFYEKIIEMAGWMAPWMVP